jgi:streptothricin acetyltransferase
MDNLRIEEINEVNQHDLNRIDSTFTIDHVLDVHATGFGDKLFFTPVTPYDKHYPPDVYDIPAYIDSNDRVIYLAYVGNTIAGQIVLKRNWNRLALIEDIEIDRSYFRQSIGTSLMDHAVSWARIHKFPAIMLETQDTNGTACRFYHAYGFKIGGFDRFLYFGTVYNPTETAIFWYYFL